MVPWWRCILRGAYTSRGHGRGYIQLYAWTVPYRYAAERSAVQLYCVRGVRSVLSVLGGLVIPFTLTAVGVGVSAQ